MSYLANLLLSNELPTFPMNRDALMLTLAVSILTSALQNVRTN
jgi:hypothetical protein